MEKESSAAWSLNQRNLLSLSPSKEIGLFLPQEAPQTHSVILVVNKLFTASFLLFPRERLRNYFNELCKQQSEIICVFPSPYLLHKGEQQTNPFHYERQPQNRINMQ